MVTFVGKRLVLLEIDESRAQELLDALAKRSYVKIIPTPYTRMQRNELIACPACDRKFGNERLVTVTEEIVQSLICMLETMSIAKSVVLIDNTEDIQRLPIPERARVVRFPERSKDHSLMLGLIQQFMDGRQETFFVTTKGINFLLDRSPLSPAKIIMSDGHVLAREGSMSMLDVKFKDKVRKGHLAGAARRAFHLLPVMTKEFVESGQIPLEM
jgi:hypothetical protein